MDKREQWEKADDKEKIQMLFDQIIIMAQEAKDTGDTGKAVRNIEQAAGMIRSIALKNIAVRMDGVI